MSGKVDLFFREFYSDEIEKKMKNYPLIRLMGKVSFKGDLKWSQPENAIIDTGAHTSLIPFDMWRGIKIEKITFHEIQGISNKPNCGVECIIGRLCSVILDKKGNQTKILNIIGLLALTDEVPLILGFKDLLSEFKVCFDYQKREAYIEESELNKKNNLEVKNDY